MPLNYLEGNQQDVYALNRLGSTFSDAIIGLQQNKLAQQRFQIQQALEQQRIALERQKLADQMQTSAAERGLITSQTDFEKARTRGEEASTNERTGRTKAGEQMGTALGEYYRVNPVPGMAMDRLLRSDIARPAATIAASSPGDIAKQAFQLQGGVDPMVARIIATGGQNIQYAPAGAGLVDVAPVGGGPAEPIYTAPNRPLASQSPEAMGLKRLQMLGSQWINAKKNRLLNTPDGQRLTEAFNDELVKQGFGNMPDSGTSTGTSPAAAGGAGGAPNGQIVVEKDGKKFFLPAEQEKDAIAQGYRRVQ